MNQHVLAEAMGRVDSRYLEQCDSAEKKSLFRSGTVIRRIALLAAVLALLATSAAAFVIAGNIRAERLSKSLFQLVLEENPAAEDAPQMIEQFYLPSLDASEAELVRAENSIGIGAEYDWRLFDSGGKSMGQITFQQLPLKDISEDGVFHRMSGLDLNALKRDTVVLNGREYATLSTAEEAHNMISYFWLDDARHYLFRMFFSDDTLLPPETQERCVLSVSPADRDAALALFDYNDWSVLMPAVDQSRFMETGREITKHTLYPECIFTWQDKAGRQILWFYEANSPTWERKQTPGSDIRTVRLGAADTAVEILTVPDPVTGQRCEVWSFEADHAFVNLEFRTVGVDFPEAEKLALFNSLHRAYPWGR